MISSVLSGNSASPSSGGGITNSSGTLAVIGSEFRGNSASAAGGINTAGMATIVGSTISGNTTFSSGSGIYNTIVGTLTVIDSTVSGNTASNGGGGGIYNAGTLTVAGSTVSDNAASDGGGITNVGALTVTDSTLSGNTAFLFSGGGISNFGPGTLTVARSTLSDNVATTTGGGVFVGASDRAPSIRNTILAGNSAPSSPDLAGPVHSQGHNLMGDGSGGSGFAVTDLVGTPESPIDPRLGALRDNGGPTLTHALLLGSPAIERGDNAGAPDWDQRGPGFPRIVNGGIDIGAFEVQAPPIDIRPGQFPNMINLHANGVLPVGVLTTPAFDATTIVTSDRASLRFGDVGLTGRVSPLRSAREDVDGDGDLDLILHFSMRRLRESGALAPTTTMAELTGVTLAGSSFRSVDSVVIVPVGQPEFEDGDLQDLVAALVGRPPWRSGWADGTATESPLDSEYQVATS